MKTGFNLLLWTTHVTESDFHLFETLRKTGYDGVEIPIFEGDVGHFRKIGKALRDNGLACTSVTIVPDDARSPVSPDPKRRQGALDHIRWAIDCSAALGSETLCGPYHQPLGVFTGEGPTEDEKARAAEVHRQAADVAAGAGVMLAIEYLNRFECYFLNTLRDAVEYVKRVNHPSFGTMFDTFHANIEEKDPVGCIAPAIAHIKHVHVSENDRGTPGRGHVDWKGTFRALRGGGYDGWLTIEAFGRALPDLAAATRVWRDFFPSREEVYTQGLRFMKREWEAAG
jgi:D-psicose/D-tagatose/L-ribulose 3-epimerase